MEKDLKVPRTIKIGVTGPSEVKNIESIRKKVRDILIKIENKITKTPYIFVVISPLAEGADRLLADEIINFKGSDNHLKSYLEVILKSDFQENSETSTDFLKLIDMSVSTKTLNEILDKDIYKEIAKEYTHAGQVVVDECDLLIAVINEKETNGDTSYIVEYARDQSNKPIFIINPNEDLINEINTEYYFKGLEYHDIYNKEKIDPKKIQRSKQEHQYLIDKMNSLNLTNEQKNLLEDNIFEQFLRANLLAMNYQFKHYWSTNLVYYFSAASVAVVALQLLFLPFYPQILAFEALMIFTIIVLVFQNKKNDWHRKWIDYRYLAERLRAAMIFSMVGLECTVLEHLPHQRLSGDWVLNAYESIYYLQLEISCPDLDFDEIKTFVLDQWIINQKDFYQEKSIFHSSRDKILNYIIYATFLGALIAAIIHSLGAIMIPFFEIPLISNIMIFVVIVFPAIAASCAGIRIQHEYLRISKRYSHMESYLNGVEYKIKKISNKDEKKLIELLEKANNMMLREHQDWRTIFSAREPELP
jgi:hypothetical protein